MSKKQINQFTNEEERKNTILSPKLDIVFQILFGEVGSEEITKDLLSTILDEQINEIDLEPNGSEFAKIVWKLLCEIPYGDITTYGELAKKVAKILNKEKMSAQAIGGAVGHNPISIIIPCHRVVGAKGNLTGYAGGINKKIELLKHEDVDINKLHMLMKGC